MGPEDRVGDAVRRIRLLVDELKARPMPPHPYPEYGHAAELSPQRTFWQTSLSPSYTKSNTQWEQDQRRLAFQAGVEEITSGLTPQQRELLGLSETRANTPNLKDWYYYADYAPWSGANRIINVTSGVTKPLYNLGSKIYDDIAMNLGGAKEPLSPDATGQINAWANNVFGNGYNEQYRDFVKRDTQRPMFDMSPRTNMGAPKDKNVVDFMDEVSGRFPDAPYAMQIAVPMVMETVTDPFMPYAGSSARQLLKGLTQDMLFGSVPTAGIVAGSLLTQPSMKQYEAAEQLQMMAKIADEMNQKAAIVSQR